MYEDYDFSPLRPLSDQEYEYLEYQVNKVGKCLFVEHFYALKRKSSDIYSKCPTSVKPYVFRKRIIGGQLIFDSKLEMHVLHKIINSPRLPREIIVAARQIYEHEMLMESLSSR